MGEEENSPKWIGWMEAWWMSFSFRLSIYHSWFPGEYGWIRWPCWWFYQVLSFKDSPWAGFGQILAVACATTQKHSCPQRHLLWVSFPTKITFGQNKDLNSWIKFRLYHNSFAPALGGACAMGANIMALIQTFQAIMIVPQRLSSSAQLTNCNVGPSWRVMQHIGACWHSAISTFHSLGQ